MTAPPAKSFDTNPAGETKPAAGAEPAGVTGEEAASRWVRGMFGKIAGHYDLLNHLLSFNLDKRWRAHAVDRVANVLANPQARVVDLCCGTGDALLALDERARSSERSSSGPIEGAPRARIFGSDFCHPMLVAAQRKIAARAKRADRGVGPATGARGVLFEADALTLPLASDSLDLITIAFGFRNLANYRRGLAEFARVLKPGGVLAILEFSQPTNPAFAAMYGFFSTRVLPRAGGMISGSREAYSYLPESIRKFPGAEDLAAQIRSAGFSEVEFDRMTFGAVALHVARK